MNLSPSFRTGRALAAAAVLTAALTGAAPAVAASAGTVAGGIAGAHSLVVQPLERVGPNITNTHWSGYDAQKGDFTAVGASWVQPSVNCSQGGDVVFWVGLGGGTATSDSLQQNGTFAECEGGTAHYLAWWETWPCNAITPYGGTVKPGDHLTATTVNEGSNEYKLTVTDSTEGWTASPTKTGCHGGTTATAEVITETPSGAGGPTALPDFGKVTYTGATINNAPLANASPTKINMARSGVIMDTTSAISGGNSFSNTWKHNS
jgi:Flp pilus assembly protein TadG